MGKAGSRAAPRLTSCAKQRAESGGGIRVGYGQFQGGPSFLSGPLLERGRLRRKGREGDGRSWWQNSAQTHLRRQAEGRDKSSF